VLSRLLAATAGAYFLDHRDAAIIRLLVETGCRRDELVALDLADITCATRRG
jgi:integrase